MTERPDNFDERLASELKGLYRGPGFGGEDGQLLAAARAAGEAVVRRGRWRWRVGFGMAAAVALAAGVLWAEMYRSRMPERVPAAVRTDKNARTGDIRDAYFVARQLKAHQALEVGWDSNGDGMVDQKDVQALALAAVRLPTEKGDVR